MSSLGDLVVNFTGNTKPLKGAIESVRSMLGGAAGMIAGVLGAGISIEAAREDIAAQKKLQAVLTATGYSAGLTAGQIRDFASSLQETTNFADEVTVGAAAILATFKSIKGDTFKETLKVAQDLATVFDMDLTAATTKLGKALQDPIHGITSLHKVGIAFTEQQKAMIKSLVESGDLMGAQKYILEQLKGSFGGAAEAMASPFKILHNLIGEIGEAIGRELLVPMKALASFLIPFIRDWGSQIAKVTLAVLALGGAMRLITAIQKAVAVGQALILALGGPAGWAALAAGAAVFASGLMLVNNEFGKMQGELDANQAKFAALAEAGKGFWADRLAGRELGDKNAAAQGEDTKTKTRLTEEFSPKFLSDQLKAAAEAFGGDDKLPWFVRAGIIEKFTGAGAAIEKLKEEMRLLNGETQSDIEIGKLWAADNGLSNEKRKEIEALIRERDALKDSKAAMEALKGEAKRIYEDTRTPMEQAAAKIAKIKEAFTAGLIDEETRDRAIAKANKDALGKEHKDHAENIAAAADVFGSSAALSNIFAAMRSKGENSAAERTAEATEDMNGKIDGLQGVLDNILGGQPAVDFAAGAV